MQPSTMGRRDWEFKSVLEHSAARMKLTYLPQWIASFIDPELLEASTAAAPPASLLLPTNNIDGCRNVGTRNILLSNILPFFSFTDTTASENAGEMWTEVEKEVGMHYAELVPNVSLTTWCTICVLWVLSDERVTTIDEDPNLGHLKLGTKVSGCRTKLGGHPAFAFRYTSYDKLAPHPLMFHIVTGTVVGNMGYIVSARTHVEEELQSYVDDVLLPAVADATHFQLDTNVYYSECVHPNLLRQQQLYGELRYFDKKSAIEFRLPMHPMRLRPDHSPIESGGFGSLTNMTIELDLYQELVDQIADTFLAAPKHRYSRAVVFVEVEDVVKRGFPPVMSIDQYAQLKTRKLLDAMPDSRVVSTPLTLQVGKRCGRSTTVTFQSDIESDTAHMDDAFETSSNVVKQSAVKAMTVSTLIGDHGATAMFFAKLGQGVFDAHLYIFQQLLNSIRFFSERELVGTFSRHKVARVWLTEQDLPRAYSLPSDHAAYERHMAAMRGNTDGDVEDVTITVIPDPADSACGVEPRTPKGTGVSDAENSEGTESDEEMEQEPVFDDTFIPVAGIEWLANGGSGWKSPTDNTRPFGFEDDESSGSMDDTKQSCGTNNKGKEGAESGDDVDIVPCRNENSEDSESSTVKTDGLNSVGVSGHEMSSSQKEFSKTSDQTRVDSAEMAAESLHKQPAEVLNNREFAEKLVAALKKEDADEKEDDENNAHLYRGQPSLRRLYERCCQEQKQRPNSYLLSKLPDNPRLTHTVEELDMTNNYVGHGGFLAILKLLQHLPKLHTLHFNSMTLDNADIEALAEYMMLNKGSAIRKIEIRNNPHITLPVSHLLLKMIRSCKNIVWLKIDGANIGYELIAKIEAEAAKNAKDSHSDF